MIAVGSGIATSPDGITWTERTHPIVNSVNGIAWNGSLWVAVGGYSGTAIATSPDGITWTARTSPFEGFGTTCWDVAWNGSLWVAVGSGIAPIATSPDGITWTSRTSPITSAVKGVAWNGSLWVAVGFGTFTVATSPDGITWTGRTATFPNGGRNVAWNGSLWVAVGESIDPDSGIATSPDGITWTGRSAGNVRDVAWNGSLWVAAAAFGSRTSPDGITWTSNSDTVSEAMAWNGSLWVGGGHGTFKTYTSSDGVTWTGRSSPLTQVEAVAARRVLPYVGFSPANAAGPTGATGATGPTGATGHTGHTGHTGAGFNAIATPAANRVLTANGTSTVAAQAQANLTFNGTTLTVTGDISTSGSNTAARVINGAGSAAAPAYTFTGDLAMGLFDPATNILGVATSGSERMRITDVGRVGIGRDDPRAGQGSTLSLDVAGCVYGRLPVFLISTTTFDLGANLATYANSYIYLTNSGFSNITTPTSTATTNGGMFFQFKNATGSFLSVALSTTLGLVSPVTIGPSNAITLVISPSNANTMLLL